MAGEFGQGPGGRERRAMDYEKYKDEMPKNAKEVPAYLKKVICGVFSRLIYIFKLIWETNKWLLFFLLFVCVLTGLFPVLAQLVTRELLNNLVYAIQGTLEKFTPIIILLVMRFSLMILQRIVSLASNMVTRISGELVTNHIKLKISEKAKDIDMASFDDPEFYEKLENANREAGTRPINIINNVFSTVSSVITLISFITILATLSSYATGLIIVLSFPSAIIAFMFRRRHFKYMRDHAKERREMNYYLNHLTDKNNAKEVRLLGLADEFISRYKEIFKYYFNGIKNLIIKENVLRICISFVTLGGSCALFGYVAYCVYHGTLQVGDYSLYTNAITSVNSGIHALIASGAAIYEGTLFIDNLITFLKEDITIKAKPDNIPMPQAHSSHTVEFHNVSFKYPGTDKFIISHLDLTLKAGETVVLVGLNGAGKTTLIKLLTRLYDPTEGYITLDGTDIRNYDPKEYYKLFGILFQDYGKYAVSAEENIMFGKIADLGDKERAKKAAIDAGASEFIEELPLGYETPLTRVFEDSGIELSGGEWQKLSIARAYFANCDIMILDEPTASLDPMAEAEIFNKFDSLREGKTTLFVSHRLSNATNADKIIVLAGGRICEEGSHGELMNKGGIYAGMFSVQAERYIAEEGRLKHS